MKLFSTESIHGVQALISRGRVMPVISVSQRALGVPLANVLYDAGIRVFEITLRSPCALQVIEDIRQALPEATVGAGTVIETAQVKQVQDAGGQFIVTPGLTEPLLDALVDSNLPAIPGIVSPSELLQGYQRGLRCFKFYPAEQAGGVKMLKAFQGPFSGIRFCPTGGLNLNNFMDYLALDNVPIVGGTWLTPNDVVEQQDWTKITALVHKTQACLKAGRENE